LIFDSFDANAEFWRTRGALEYADEIDAIEHRYVERADAVVAASTVLAERAFARDRHGPVYYIPNGVDLRGFGSDDRQRARTRFGFDGPIVGSLANHDSSVELDLILDAARRFSGTGIRFVIAGRGGALAAAARRARRDGLDVQFHGYVPLEEAPRFVAAFDVGLCVYARTPMDDARTPMRLLMYAAAGVPTVATDLEEVRRLDLPNVVRVDDDGAAVARGIRDALEMPLERPVGIEAFDLPRLVARYEAVLEGTALAGDEFVPAPPWPGTSIHSVSSR
jgi:glycosyltransferase involved in cell wall biosynthesis